jgi:porphobilinogen deaminase
VLSPDGARRVEATLTGSAADAETVGQLVAEELLARGARELIG